MQAAFSAHTSHTRDIRQKQQTLISRNILNTATLKSAATAARAAHPHAPARHASSMGSSSSSSPFSSSPPSSSWVNPQTTRWVHGPQGQPVDYIPRGGFMPIMHPKWPEPAQKRRRGGSVERTMWLRRRGTLFNWE